MEISIHPNPISWLISSVLSSLFYTASVLAIPTANSANITTSTGQPKTSSLLAMNLAPSNGLKPVKPGYMQNINQLATIPCLEGVQTTNTDSASSTTESCDSDKDTGQSVASYFGRIRGEGTDISGNFDGFNLAYQIHDGLHLRGFAGYPDLSNSAEFDKSRYIYGLNTQFRNPTRTSILNSYFIDQHADGAVTDRLIGGSIQYSQLDYSLVVLFDYDLEGKSYAGLSTTGAWQIHENTTISATVDIRHMPMRNRQQRYLRQSMETTEGWAWVLPDERIKQLAKSYSNGVTGMAVSLSHTFSEYLKINGSLSVLHASNRDQDRINCGIPERTNEYFYRLKLSRTNWMAIGDKSRLELHHQVTDAIRSTTASLDTKYPISTFWNFQPKFQTKLTSDMRNHSIQSVSTPTLSLEYLSGDDSGLQIEAGGKWESAKASDKHDSTFSYYVSLDYHKTFK